MTTCSNACLEGAFSEYHIVHSISIPHIAKHCLHVWTLESSHSRLGPTTTIRLSMVILLCSDNASTLQRILNRAAMFWLCSVGSSDKTSLISIIFWFSSSMPFTFLHLSANSLHKREFGNSLKRTFLNALGRISMYVKISRTKKI